MESHVALPPPSPHWMSLTAHRRLGRYAFDFQGNVPKLGRLRFTRRRGTLQLWLGEAPWATIEGWARATVQGRRFEPRLSRLLLAGLRAEGIALDFQWLPEGSDCRERARLHVDCSLPPGERYTVWQGAWSWRRPVIALRIECAAAPRHPDMMLLALAYCWNHFESGRTWT